MNPHDVNENRSQLALDLQAWLVHLLSIATRDRTIDWRALELQFGTGVQGNFKNAVLDALPSALSAVPQARVSATEAGLHIEAAAHT